MIKNMLVLLLLFSTVQAYALDIADSSVNRIAGSREMSVLIEDGNSFTIYDILGRRSGFTPAGKDFFPYSDKTVWTSLPLVNKSGRTVTLHLVNDFAAMDEVDFYIVRGWNVTKTEKFGDQRPLNLTSVLKRYPNIAVTLEPRDNIMVFARYHSTSPVKTKLRIFDQSSFNSFVIKDVTLWGMFIGITLALIVYNLMIFTSLKDIAFVIYIIHSITNIYNALTTSGHIHTYLSPYISSAVLDISYKLMPSLGIIFMLLFTITLFDLKRNIRWLYNINLFTIAVFSVLAVSVTYFQYTDNLMALNKATAVMVQFGLLVVIFSSVAIKHKKLMGSTLFLLGTGTFMIFIFCYMAYFLGKVNFGTWIIYAVPFGKTIDAFLFAVILKMKIGLIEKERMENALLVEEMNKFNSTSYLLAGILHQFKQPLIYLGSEVLNIKAEYFRQGKEADKESRMLSNMEKHIQSMNELVGNFYSFYSKESKKAKFDVEQALQKVLNILDASIKNAGISVKIECGNQKIMSDEKTLNQALLIILENAVSILAERKIESPCIRICCKGDSEICVEDNGGGISAADVDKVFNIHYSAKQSGGLGIGLALAKNLVENKLHGTISAGNGREGARFTIKL